MQTLHIALPQPAGRVGGFHIFWSADAQTDRVTTERVCVSCSMVACLRLKDNLVVVVVVVIFTLGSNNPEGFNNTLCKEAGMAVVRLLDESVM